MENKDLNRLVRDAARFNTSRGQQVTLEDLWQMPLDGNGGFNLDNVAVILSDLIDTSGRKSFVKKTNKSTAELERKLDYVKFVIATKMEEAEKKLLAKDRKAKKAKLLELISKKQDEAQEGKSVEDLMKELDELDSDEVE